MAIKKYYPIISNSADPTTTTEGKVGQKYVNETTGDIFLCINNASNTYTWKKVKLV